MCGRFFLADSDNSGELRGIIDQLNRRGATVKTGEIFPTDTVPVLANNRNRRVVPFPMQWGYTLPDGRLLINARSETAGEKPLFQDAMRQHRCLIPATDYFEWEKRGRGENQVRHPTGGCRLAIHGGAVPRGERARSVHHSNA
ncbi:MAG: SOS response-associated peptidase family protein [Christensenellales bacterium]